MRLETTTLKASAGWPAAKFFGYPQDSQAVLYQEAGAEVEAEEVVDQVGKDGEAVCSKVEMTGLEKRP